VIKHEGPDDEVDARLHRENDALRTANTELKARAGEAESLALEALDKLDALENEQTGIEADHDVTIGRLRDMFRDIGGASETVDRALHVFLDRIEFNSSSVDYLATLSDPTQVFAKLKMINSGSMNYGSQVKGANGWREIHFSTGKSDDGRLYFRPKELRVDVVVSQKRFQRRDIGRIRRLR